MRLSRPVSRPHAGSAVPGYVFGTPWNANREGPPNTNRSPERNSRSMYGLPRVSDVPEAEQARVADAQRHDRRVAALVGVLMHPHLRAVVVEVDQRGVGIERHRRVPIRVRQRATTESPEPVRERRDRRAVDVVRGPAVAIRQPMPPEAHGLHRHHAAVRQLRMAHRRRPARPLAARRHQLPLLLQRQPRGTCTAPGATSERARANSDSTRRNFTRRRRGSSLRP